MVKGRTPGLVTLSMQEGNHRVVGALARCIQSRTPTHQNIHYGHAHPGPVTHFSRMKNFWPEKSMPGETPFIPSDN